MFYGKYDDDEPSLAQKIARELEKGKQDDEVRLTARYCNSGDGGGSPHAHSSDYTDKPKPKKSKPFAFADAKVGEYIEGLEELGKVVSISGPGDYKEPEPPLNDKKINKMRKWLEKKGFQYEEEYEGQHGYWMESKKLSVTTDPRFIIVNWIDWWDEEETYIDLKSAKTRIKEILSI
jgi:hypothetical protein